MMKRALLLLLVPLMCGWPAMSVGVGGGTPASASFTALWTEDFELTGGADCSGELTIGSGSTAPPDCDYTTSPISGSQSAQVGNAFGADIRQDITHTMSSGVSQWRLKFRVNDSTDPEGTAATYAVYRSYNGGTSSGWRVQHTGSGTQELTINCQTSSSNTDTNFVPTDDVLYYLTVVYNHDNDSGELFISSTAFSTSPSDSKATCDGTGTSITTTRARFFGWDLTDVQIDDASAGVHP